MNAYVCAILSLYGLILITFQTDVEIETPYSAITILQGDDVTMSCIPSVLEVALEWLYNGRDISSSSQFQFTPPFLSHDLTIIYADDIDSGEYVCAFKLRDEVIAQASIALTVVPSEYMIIT